MPSEPNRSKRHTQIVVRAIVEVHLIACFDADSKGAGGRLDATARIGRDVRAAVAERVKRAGERRAGSRGIAYGEIGESDLARYERAEWSEVPN